MLPFGAGSAGFAGGVVGGGVVAGGVAGGVVRGGVVAGGGGLFPGGVTGGGGLFAGGVTGGGWVGIEIGGGVPVPGFTGARPPAAPPGVGAPTGS